MPELPFFTVDVFTEKRFGGNPLAVVMGGEALDQAAMQAIAAEFNLSETAFLLPPEDPGNTARVRIFNRMTEMAFAGHPMVGTAFVLASRRPGLTAARFEIPAGIVRVGIERNAAGTPVSTSIDAPQPLSVGDKIAPDAVAKALRLRPDDVVTSNHPPIVASNGMSYVIAEVTGEALSRCDPDLAAFRSALDSQPHLGTRFSLHVYHRNGKTLRARMFAPLAGTWEDPATGGANTSLACLLLSLDQQAQDASFDVHQGIEMGRPSLLHLDARRTPNGILATLRGSSVSVMHGMIDL